MSEIKNICDNLDITARQLIDFYDDVKRWERYLNHCWCAKINDKHENFQLSGQQLDLSIKEQEKLQTKLALFKRFPPEKYFRKTVVNYQNLLDQLKDKTVYILHLCERWLKQDAKRFYEQIEFFESLEADHLGPYTRNPEARFIIIDYDLNTHLLKDLLVPDKCCIHHVEQNVLLSMDCHEEFLRE